MKFLMQRSRTGRRTLAAVTGVLVALAVVGASCGSDSDTASDESTDTIAAGTDASTEGVEVEGAWARTSPMAADMGAAYMQLTSADGDRLVSASVDSSIAGSVEIHETVAVEDDSDDMDDGDDMAAEDDGEEMGSETTDQAMTMQELPDGLELPAGETVILEPGGYHIMLLDLPEPLVAGESFELVLEFENAGTQTATVAIRDEAP